MRQKLKEEFIESILLLEQRDGGAVLSPLVESLQNDMPSVAVRINPLKESGTPATRRKVAWARNGVYVDGERPRFTLDPAMHQGRYYVQDPSSMIIETIVGELAGAAPIIYIDTCAAPGGKTTGAISALPAGSLVIANEFDRKRADALCENIIKWGYPDVVVTSNDTARLAAIGALADIVGADVPCSGEGMMRKEPTAVEQWSPSLVEQCATLQRNIIDNAWKMLKPGGYLIYSTCTFNHSENEDNLAYIIEELGGEPVDLHLAEKFADVAPAIDSPYPAARFIPGRTEGEGLFVAVVRRRADAEPKVPRIKPHKQGKDNNTDTGNAAATAKGWINNGDYLITAEGDRLTAYPRKWADTIRELRRVANVIYAGVELATVKGRDIVPSQALALSPLIDISAFDCVEVDYATALQYLSRQALTLPGAPKGIVLLTYQRHPLGFVKNLGNRANNLYPQPWAIRTTHFTGQEEPGILLPPSCHESDARPKP